MSLAITYHTELPDGPLAPYVKFFWRLNNPDSAPKIVTVLPDGYFDVLVIRNKQGRARLSLSGLSTGPVQYHVPPGASTFAISFRLPAAEYLLRQSLAGLLNTAVPLPDDWWDMAPVDFTDFQGFVRQASHALSARLPPVPDPRKMELFHRLYAADGEGRMNDLATEAFWSSRQITRYFRHWFGLTLKAYCGILRYRGSFPQLRDGRLYPEADFFDQSHFIREVRRYSGVSPRALALNENDRFIQLATLPPE